MIPLMNSLRQHADDTTWRGRQLAGWRVAPSEPGELRVVFLRSILTYDEVRPLFDWLLSEPAPAWQAITLDFTPVRDIAAPWAPVFAHLEYVATQTQVHCRLVGMNERLTSMAAFAMVDAVAGKSESPAVVADDVCEVGQC